MAQWVYQLKSGKELREAINNEDYHGTLTRLGDCYREIHKNLPDLIDEDQLEELIAEIDNQEDNLNNYDDYNLSLEEVIEEIDYLLSEFYDFCDNCRIWVEIN